MDLHVPAAALALLERVGDEDGPELVDVTGGEIAGDDEEGLVLFCFGEGMVGVSYL